MQEIETIRDALNATVKEFSLADEYANKVFDECICNSAVTKSKQAITALNSLEAKLNKPIDVEKVARAVYDEHYKDSPKQGRDIHWKIEDVKCFWGGCAQAAITETNRQRAE